MIGAEGKYLRLISAGKMLNPDESIIKDFGLSDNCYVHCVVTAAPPRLRLPSLTPVEQAEEEVRYGHSGIVLDALHHLAIKNMAFCCRPRGSYSLWYCFGHALTRKDP